MPTTDLSGSGRPRQRMSRRAGFWLFTVSLFGLMAAAGAPSPLYGLYQQLWGFSTGMLTLVFACYAFALLVALLIFGGLSDHVGRRPVLVAALAVETIAMVLFLIADGPGWLIAARTVQGLATGAATGAIAAGLIELQPKRGGVLGPVLASAGTPAGVALGGLLGGLVLQLLPMPQTVVFAAFAIFFAVLAILAIWLPETSPQRPGARASLAPRVGVPAQARGVFARAAAATIATWALVGLYMSIGPSLAIHYLGLPPGLASGVVVTALTGSAAIAGTLLRGYSAERAMPPGLLALAVGTTLAVLFLFMGSAVGFFIATVVAGSGFGVAFFGAFRSLAAVETDRRAELSAAFYVASYLALGAPAVVAGILVPVLGLDRVVVGYGVLVVLMGLGAGIASLLANRKRAAGQA
ncbi:MFS transporter [Granulicoccus phenolivorans]|uniref:MFS transporter n=1 Tax=Granulicoccus phenolivorans TaxID=266854 RepID=UPI0005524B92|nr:MFS transporter [Granulicoccus phenolivorans]